MQSIWLFCLQTVSTQISRKRLSCMCSQSVHNFQVTLLFLLRTLNRYRQREKENDEVKEKTDGVSQSAGILAS